MFDVITIGSATLDTFVECSKAHILSVNSPDKNSEFLCFPYGSKLEVDEFSRNLGGGGTNTAANFAHLGFKTSTIAMVGDDEVGHAVKESLESKGIDTSKVITSHEHSTGFSMILVSFQGDRTVLAHRGANAYISENDIDLNGIKGSKWIYVAPLAGESNKVLNKIADYAQKHGVKLALNAGTTGILKGEEYFSKILKSADIFILNKEEAILLTGMKVRPDSKDEHFSNAIIHPDIVDILKHIKEMTHGTVVMTDGKKGSFAYDGQKLYFAPEFPAKVRSTLGAGDCFTSTFAGAVEKYGNDTQKALACASVNAASVVESWGAQDNFLTFEEIETRLKANPDYKVTVLD